MSNQSREHYLAPRADLFCPSWVAPAPARQAPQSLGLQGSPLHRSVFLVHPHLSNAYPSVKVDLGLLLGKLCWASSAYRTLPSFESFSILRQTTFTLDELCSALLSHYAVNVYCIPGCL